MTPRAFALGALLAMASLSCLACAAREPPLPLAAAVGQVLIVNVDGFGATGDLALAPAFAPMVTRLQVGGVIPHYGTLSRRTILATNRALEGMTEIPLLVCSDLVRLRGPAGIRSVGDGYVGGFLGHFRELPDGELETLGRLNAFVLAGLGVNVSLGPTVDSSTGDPRTADRGRRYSRELSRYGLQVVLKHFPWIPEGVNLHRESPDERLPLPQAQQRFDIFRELAGEADLVMTTHLYDSAVDDSLATFSSRWVSLLRSRAGYRGLVMTDGLLMLRHYEDHEALNEAGAPKELQGMDPAARWAARAILAGHDLVIVEGSAEQTQRVYDGLLAAASGSGPLAAKLKRRILDSGARIARWKRSRQALLRRVVEVPAAAMDQALSLLPPDAADLARFRFDPAALKKLEPALEAARVR